MTHLPPARRRSARLAQLPDPLRCALTLLIVAAVAGCGQAAPSVKDSTAPPASSAQATPVSAQSIHGVWAIDVDETVELAGVDEEKSAKMATELRGFLGSLRYMFAADGTARAQLMNQATSGTWRVVKQEADWLDVEVSLEDGGPPEVARITVKGPDALVFTSGDKPSLALKRASATVPWAQQPPPRLAPAPSGAADPAPTGPAATVNGVEIPRAAIEAKFDTMRQTFGRPGEQVPAELAAKYRRTIAKHLIETELMRQEIAKQKIEVDAAALDAAFANYRARFPDEATFQQDHTAPNITVEQARDNLRHVLAVELLLAQGGALEITDEAVREHYAEHQQAYQVKEQVRASHILFKAGPGDGPEVEAKARQRADEIYALATAPGADFAALAKAHSEGPTAPRGGDLGFFPRNRMVPEFEEAAFDTPAGEVAQPIKTRFGWHVIKVTDRRESRQLPLDEARASIVEQIQKHKRAAAKGQLMKRLRSEAQIEIFLP